MSRSCCVAFGRRSIRCGGASSPRHEPGDERDWHVRRAPELERILDEADTADLTVDVRDDSPEQVAARVLAATHFTE